MGLGFFSGFFSCGLDGSDDHSVDNIRNQAATGEVVDGLAETLQDRTDGDGAGRTLNRLVRVVASIESGEDKDGGSSRNLTVR